MAGSEAFDEPIPPSERIPVERAAAAARTELGEAGFAAAWAAGRALLLEEAVTEALALADVLAGATLEPAT